MNIQISLSGSQGRNQGRFRPCRSPAIGSNKGWII